MNYTLKQAEIIEASKVNSFVIAGAGSGKTSTIIGRIDHILSKEDKFAKILVLSFTKDAVNELKMRLAKSTVNVSIMTFHSLCFQMVSLHNSIRLFDDKYRSLLALSDADLLSISSEKRLSDFKNMTTKRNNTYMRFLSENGLIDYIDLENLAIEYLIENKMKHNFLYRFDYIFVDEFQDVSDIQYTLLKLLKFDFSTYFAVGDPNQSIYRFRGTGSQIIKRYNKDFNAKLFYLNENFRSTPNILFHSNSLIKYNKDDFKLTLNSIKTAVGTVLCYVCESQFSESSLVLLNIRKLLSNGIRAKDVAILYRFQRDAITIKKQLRSMYILDLNLMTIHQSKGLEFKAVFIIGSNSYHYDSKEDLREERRLFYVAMTRAKDFLFITSNQGNKRISRFITEAKIKYETLD